MTIKSKIIELEQRLPQENRDIILYAKHVIDALDNFEEHHRQFVAAQAIAGVKQDGRSEVTFYDTVQQIKNELFATLQETVEDIEHKGQKHYDKHFRDGVE